VELPLRDSRAVHLIKTLHKTMGSLFDAGVINGNRGRGVILSVGMSVAAELVLNEPPPPRLPVCLGVGFARPIQLRRIFREAANFGLESVDVFGTALGDKSYLKTTLLEDGGARDAMLEGAVEARDTRFPDLRRFFDVSAWLAGLKKKGCRIALDNENPRGSFFEKGPLSQADGGVTLAVGSERGWSDGERTLLESAGFVRLSVGERALRTETACIVAVTLAMERVS
jgi:RsmE family RNA methyltransferase